MLVVCSPLQLGNEYVTYKNEIVFSSVRNPGALRTRYAPSATAVWAFTHPPPHPPVYQA